MRDFDMTKYTISNSKCAIPNSKYATHLTLNKKVEQEKGEEKKCGWVSVLRSVQQKSVQKKIFYKQISEASVQQKSVQLKKLTNKYQKQVFSKKVFRKKCLTNKYQKQVFS